MHDSNPSAPDPAQPGTPADVTELAARLTAAEAAVAEMRETLLRERAELENQRRRLQRDLEQARRYANEKLLADLLPVRDSLERGLGIANADAASLRAGMELTLKALAKVTESAGLAAIDPLGQPFDAERHQAMSMVESSEHAPDSVVSVLQKGYLLNDRLLRPALVAVARAPADA